MENQKINLKNNRSPGWKFYTYASADQIRMGYCAQAALIYFDYNPQENQTLFDVISKDFYVSGFKY